MAIGAGLRFRFARLFCYLSAGLPAFGYRPISLHQRNLEVGWAALLSALAPITGHRWRG